MDTRWRYRVASVAGTAVFVGVAITLVNQPVVQEAFAAVPYFGRPAPEVLSNGALFGAIATAVTVALAAMWPLFKPRPRRILDAVLETQRRVLLSMVALAALGYFNYTYRLPRSTVILSTALLLVTLPVYMVAIRRRPQSAGRALLIGDDPDAMQAIVDASDLPIVGYVAPSSLSDAALTRSTPAEPRASDGHDRLDGTETRIERVGGLSRIEDVIVANDIDTVLLAFGSPDRAEFFGTLAACHEHGLGVKIHRDHADTVLTARTPEGELVDVDLEPWDLQDRVLKRLFDLTFAAVALAVLAPVVLAIAAAIKLDDGGPTLYGQERTAEFGDTFTVYKFRTMRPGEAESEPGDERERVTRVGRVLRQTHLDEIPQLWSILTGRMSVVGPRATWTDEETHLEAVVSTWRKRWFVKPGLTGIAQINDIGSTEPENKLRYDLQYIRQQSFRVDLQIVLRQLWQVGRDVVSSVRGGEANADEPTVDESPDDGEPRAPDVHPASDGSADESASASPTGRVVTDGSPDEEMSGDHHSPR